ncbi:beta-1,3-glucan-binding protein [Leptinotarsa decemlineata]|uniref:beta-1,3-glucan-binding protein n=1 Tax=Leptinotarsa decemlineata TaxID=7539 RepID=UPI003D306895
MKRLLCLSLVLQVALPAAISQEFTVPVPRIQVLSPRGFRVSIPDQDGIQLFAFHGSLNKPMNGLEAGEFSRDILIKTDGQWVFEDHTTKLKPGDVINYWLFVIKDRLGYRYDNGEFHVRDVPPSSTILYNQHPSAESTTNKKDKPEIYSNCRCQMMTYVMNKVNDLALEVEKLRENTGVLQELMEKNEMVSQEMKFEGVLPPYEDAAYVAQVIINGKLGLSVPVLNASRNNDNSITFRLASLGDKVTVIKVAKKELINSKIKLIY